MWDFEAEQLRDLEAEEMRGHGRAPSWLLQWNEVEKNSNRIMFQD